MKLPEFHPKFPSYRMRMATLAIMFGIVGGVILLSGHDTCHRAEDRLIIAGILALGAAIPESPEKKSEPEKYSLTGQP
jgi:hypothetical protein